MATVPNVGGLGSYVAHLLEPERIAQILEPYARGLGTTGDASSVPLPIEQAALALLGLRA